jgi:hypothetical protein
VEPLIAQWKASDNPPDTKEIARRLIDLFVVSVLLDAGAGSKWSYQEPSGGSFSRSEGLGVASVYMFADGFFSGDPTRPHQVDGKSPVILVSPLSDYSNSGRLVQYHTRKSRSCYASFRYQPDGRHRGSLDTPHEPR